MIKWIFFDVGSTLVDETEAYDHRVRDMTFGTNITFKNLTMPVLRLLDKVFTATLPLSNTLS